MEENKKSNNKLIVVVLAVLLLSVVAYTFYSNNEHSKLTAALTEEKTEITKNLDNMVAQYDEAIAKNTAVSNELAAEKERIVALKEAVTKLKATNYSLIRNYRKQIAKLEETNKRLFFVNDSLTTANNTLTTNLGMAKATISKQMVANEDLTSKNNALSHKVAIGSRLKVANTKTIAMRERRNGKMAKTSRSRNTDAFSVTFTIGKNEISEQGNRKVTVEIKNAEDAVVANNVVTVNYLNEEVDVVSLLEVDRKSVHKGTYTATIFIENNLVASQQITLK